MENPNDIRPFVSLGEALDKVIRKAAQAMESGK